MTTVVLSGTGKTGRRVAERLQAQGRPVRIGSRSGQLPFDWQDQATWSVALRGASAAYAAYYPDLAVPGAVAAIEAFTEAARAAGVRRVVLLSGRGEEEAQRAEHVVQRSGLEWTILRASWMNQNFSEGYLQESVLHGEVVLPARDVPEPFVDADDIADVAVAALTDDRHVGELYELTGPRLLTFADAVQEIAKEADREIRFLAVTGEQYAAALAEFGVPAEFQWLLDYLFATVLDGRNAHLTDGVRRALGREPKDFADYARETVATGVWAAPAQ